MEVESFLDTDDTNFDGSCLADEGMGYPSPVSSIGAATMKDGRLPVVPSSVLFDAGSMHPQSRLTTDLFSSSRWKQHADNAIQGT